MKNHARESAGEAAAKGDRGAVGDDRNGTLKHVRRQGREDVIRHFIQDRSEELFIAHGYLGTSMDMIAAECGLSKPTLYRYFKSKYELFTSLYVRLYASLREILEGLPAAPGRDAWRSLAEFVDQLFILINAKKNFLRMYFREQHLVIHENIEEHITWHADIRTSMESLLAELLREAVRPEVRRRFGVETVASTVLNLLEGMISDLILHETEDIAGQKAFILELLRNGVLTAEPKP